jgi:hypothetical protein
VVQGSLEGSDANNITIEMTLNRQRTAGYSIPDITQDDLEAK